MEELCIILTILDTVSEDVTKKIHVTEDETSIKNGVGPKIDPYGTPIVMLDILK